MSSLASIMDASLSGMLYARVAMQTVSHNIANANTPGFSRQDVLAAAKRPLQLAYGSLGRGVSVEQVRRLTDAFLLQKHRTQSSRMASYEQVDGALGEIEAIFGSVSNDHLGKSLTEFFNAWSDLAAPPINDSLKPYVVTKAQSLVTDLRSTDSSLRELERSLNDDLAREVANLNGLLAQVADLNRQILYVESSAAEANDLRDQRDVLIDEVSRLARVSVLERDDGTVDLIIRGRTVVTRGEAQALELRRDFGEAGETASIVTREGGVPVELDEGKLQGLIEARQSQVTMARERLDELAGLLIARVNELHTQGRTAGSSGILFFTGDSAATIALNPAIATDYDLVATSRSGLEGDNDIARAIANLATQPLDGEGSLSLMDRYNALVVDLASERSSFQFLLENQRNVVETLTARIESVRGVSLDEEGANLVRFQNAYEASARVVTAATEMFDTLLNMI
jgi:flagellar hook-associated protein 1 FlgK